MRDSQAIKPDKIFFNLPSLVKQQAAEKKGATDEMIALAAMAETSGWKYFSDLVDEVVKDLDQINESAIASGASYEEIGKNTLIISLTKGIIKKVIDRVKDSKEELDRPAKE